MRQYKLVYVKWVDSNQLHGWGFKEDLEEHDMNIISCGFLINETPHSITLTTSISKECFLSSVQIPKIAIKSIEDINHDQNECDKT